MPVDAKSEREPRQQLGHACKPIWRKKIVQKRCYSGHKWSVSPAQCLPRPLKFFFLLTGSSLFCPVTGTCGGTGERGWGQTLQARWWTPQVLEYTGIRAQCHAPDTSGQPLGVFRLLPPRGPKESSLPQTLQLDSEPLRPSGLMGGLMGRAADAEYGGHQLPQGE